MTKVAIYARFSPHPDQRDESIEDQIRICRERADKEGWEIVETYADFRISGASLLLRPEIQQMIEDAHKGKFSIVIAESLDRLSRNLEDIAAVYNRLRFAGVSIFTLSEGEVSELHIGLKGTMSQLFLKDLAAKVHRGLRGRVENGYAASGKSYGYDVQHQFDDAGKAVKGERTINQGEAAIVKRIFKEYGEGRSPRSIAKQLNKEGIVGPSGKEWGQSTINGNRQRGNGILNNELYIGQMVWNRQRYIKNPETGRRVARPNPESEWIRKDVPHLRILEQDLWNAVKQRQGSLDRMRAYDADNPMTRKRRPIYLFSGLTKCSECGGGFSKVSDKSLGCSTARNKGTCDNRRTIRQDELERRVLRALRQNLMEPALFEQFCEAYTEHSNELRKQHNRQIEAWRADFKTVDAELEKCVDLMLSGVPPEKIKERMVSLDLKKKELESRLEAEPETVAILHPKMSIVYKTKLDELFEQLANAEQKDKAFGIVRSLVDKIIMSPNEDDGLDITLVGDLAGILTVATGSQEPLTARSRLVSNVTAIAGRLLEAPEDQQIGGEVTLGAGRGFEPLTFRL